MTLPTKAPHSSQDRLDLLYNLSQAFNSSLDLDEVLNRVIDEVIVVTQAERGFVMLHDDQGKLVFRVARGIDQTTISDPVFQVSISVVKGVARDGQPVLTGDAQMDPRFSMRQSVKLLGLRSILCVPLKVKEQILGIVYVDNRIQAGIFTPADLDLLSAIASSAAIAIENARLYQVAVEKGRLEQELQMARQLQSSLLPSTTPQVSGWEFAARWLPARQVAGDYYDFIPIRAGKLGLVIADVSDKGMSAALFMALTRSTVRACMDNTAEPMEGMTCANHLIFADSINSMFVTLFYALIDPQENRITYVNAGHNPPLLYQPDKSPQKGRLSYLGRTGMALGIWPDSLYQQETLSFNPGDFLVMYTDGVTDTMDVEENFFGTEKLEQVVMENAHETASAAQMVKAIEQAVENFSQSPDRFDDITLLVVKRL